MSSFFDEVLERDLAFGKNINDIIAGHFHEHKMTRQEIRNYMHSHNVESINKDTLYNFFGSNIYDVVDGCKHYFIHEILSSKFEIDKVYKALEAAFIYLGPNTGDLIYGENYFQTFMLNYSRLGFSKFDDSVQIMSIVALLELGFKYGLDPNFKSAIEGNSIWHHLFLCIMNFKVLEGVFNSLDNDKIDGYSKINTHTLNFYSTSPFHYLNIKLTNKYISEFSIDKDMTKIAVVYFNKFNGYKINKKVNEDRNSLIENYEADGKSGKLHPSYVEIDPLLLRFLTKEGLIFKCGNYGDIYYDVYTDFNLSGYGALDCFLEFYWRVLNNYNYNREEEESIKTLRKILKKDD